MLSDDDLADDSDLDKDKSFSSVCLSEPEEDKEIRKLVADQQRQVNREE